MPMLFSIISYICGIQAAEEPKNVLFVAYPQYAEVAGFLYFWPILFAIIAIFSVYNSEKLLKTQQIMLNTTSCYMLMDHLLLEYILNIPLIGHLAKYLLFFIILLIGILSLNVKFRRLFGSFGTGYILAYEIELMLKIGFSTFILCILILTLGFVALGKFYEQIFAFLQKGVVCPFLLLVTINLLFGGPISSMHFENGSTTASVIGKIFLVLGVVCAMVYIFFSDKIIEKYEDYKAQVVEAKEEEKEEEKV